MTLSSDAIGLLHRGAGRKRIRNRRPEADLDHRTVEPSHLIRAPAIASRIKFAGATVDNALDACHETTIGQLFLRGQLRDPSGISEGQYDAAGRYRRCVLAYHGLNGFASPHVRASGQKGRGCEPDPDQAVINEILGNFRNCRAVLLHCGQVLGLGSQINRIVYAVVIEDMNIGGLRQDDFGNLRNGLNALARYFK